MQNNIFNLSFFTLTDLILNFKLFFYGGRNRARTYDPLLVRQVLSQLSYAPIKTYLW